MITFQDSATICDVQWLRAAAGAKLFPGPHKFGSRRTWWRGKSIIAVGEVGQAETASCQDRWGYSGQNFCGPLDAWRNGGVLGITPVIELLPDGSSTCCRPALKSAGGARVGGTSRQRGNWFHRTTGGETVGGTAAIAGNTTLFGSGGEVDAGASSFGTGVSFFGGGGLAAGGTGGTATGSMQSGAGGLDTGGTGVFAQGTAFITSGGESSSGLAGYGTGAGQLGAGGLDQGGTAGVATGGYLIGEGGLVEGGDSDFLQGPLQEGEGGEKDGGDSDFLQGPLQEGEGGEDLGGVAVQTGTAAGPPCATSNTYRCVVTGVTGTSFCTSANATFAMTFVSGQTWSATPTGWTGTLNLTGPTFTMTFTRGVHTAVFSSATFNCTTGGTFSFTSATLCSWPATVAVTSP